MKKRFHTRNIMAFVAICLVALFEIGCDGGSGGDVGCADGICQEEATVNGASEARLYYPADISGQVGATSLTSGWLATYSEVEWLALAITKAGYVVLAATPNKRGRSVSQWKDTHVSCIAKLQELNQTHAVLRGKVDTAKLQICGHSKGGGGALWAASELQQQIKSTIAMAPYQEQFTNDDLSTITAATLIQAGDLDNLASGGMTLGEYEALPAAISKAYIRYADTDHVAWTSFGENQERLTRDVIAWMKYYLDGDLSQAASIEDTSGTTMHQWMQ